MNPFDSLLFRRTLSAFAFATVVAIGVISATDEATSSVAMRAARFAAFCPLLSACAILAVVGHARSRGEVAALVAIGVSPWRAARGASLVGLLAAVLCAAILASPWADVESLFPAVRPSLDWTLDPVGGVARAAGIAIESNGRITLALAAATVQHAPDGVWRAIPCIVPVALLVPLWASTPMALPLRLGSSMLVVAVTIVVLHLVAAERASAFCGFFAAAPLVVSTVLARRG